MKVSIFIVEDDLELRNLYEIFFKSRGYEVIDTATNGQEAIDKYNTFLKKPDIIIMDYLMPYMNGLDATKEILKINNNAKIILMSVNKTIERLAYEYGAIDFINKGMSLKLFNKRIIDSIKNQSKREKGFRIFGKNSHCKCSL